ncbi:struthiocalcin-2-like [Aedes aegypti]|uniref:Uncharacterized protein n=1 Tax=Aedes aegypti TaxID=7159 RepID=A0A6I8U7J9_AEDAE|nr:struthiocalcin-2-like [Aedes aegypti]
MKSQIIWLLAGLVVLVVCDSPAQGMRAECDDEQTYIIPHFKSNWYKAMEYCHYLGLKLATVPSIDKQLQIEDSIERTDKGNGTTFWTGGNDLGDNENFHWYSTGTRIVWFNWSMDAYSRNGNCIYLHRKNDDPSTWSWSTERCSQAKYFVCERA